MCVARLLTSYGQGIAEVFVMTKRASATRGAANRTRNRAGRYREGTTGPILVAIIGGTIILSVCCNLLLGQDRPFDPAMMRGPWIIKEPVPVAASGAAVLAITTNGVSLTDTSGDAVAQLSLTESGRPFLTMTDLAGSVRIVITVDKDGSALIRMLDLEERTRVEFGTDSAGEPVFRIKDEIGVVIWKASVPASN